MKFGESLKQERELRGITLEEISESTKVHVRFLGVKRLKMLFYMNDFFRVSTVRTERGINYPYARSFSLGIQARF